MEAPQAVQRSDRRLAQAVLLRGDEKAFREMYRRHTPRLLGFVSRLLAGTPAEVEDVVQETWIRACDGLASFRWESAFSTWLLGIGLNVVRACWRSRAQLESIKAQVAPDSPGAGVSLEERIDLERCIRALPNGFRTVLLLHDIEGMKHEEIAERLGIAVGTSKSQLSDARRMIRTMMCRPMEIRHD